MEALTLYELNGLVRGTLERTLQAEYWLQAELSEVREAYNGHCYLEFVQKSVNGRDLVAKARGVIWAGMYRLLKPMFERETGRTLSPGLKVLVKVGVTFHELYGYSLTVTDIDPAYTLGDMARLRREILARLEADGILNDNKELSLPLSANRIAVISSATAAGYGDFCNQLLRNDYRLRFTVRLFPAVMQGEHVESSVLAALDAVMARQDDWDAVVIIRGGGATSDLSGFDTYLLAAACAQFPLPVITGIGHERDDTVIDLVAHTRVKTLRLLRLFSSITSWRRPRVWRLWHAKSNSRPRGAWRVSVCAWSVCPPDCRRQPCRCVPVGSAGWSRWPHACSMPDGNAFPTNAIASTCMPGG